MLLPDYRPHAHVLAIDDNEYVCPHLRVLDVLSTKKGEGVGFEVLARHIEGHRVYDRL